MLDKDTVDFKIWELKFILDDIPEDKVAVPDGFADDGPENELRDRELTIELVSRDDLVSELRAVLLPKVDRVSDVTEDTAETLNELAAEFPDEIGRRELNPKPLD